MPFDFKKLYMVRNPEGNMLGRSCLALGVRTGKTARNRREKLRFAVQYRRPGIPDGNMVRTIFGEIMDDSEDTGVITVRDHGKALIGRKPVTWEFTPMTLDLWKGMGEHGLIDSYEELLPYMKTTAHLHEYYNDMFRAAWWSEEIPSF